MDRHQNTNITAIFTSKCPTKTKKNTKQKKVKNRVRKNRKHFTWPWLVKIKRVVLHYCETSLSLPRSTNNLRVLLTLISVVFLVMSQVHRLGIWLDFSLSLINICVMSLCCDVCFHEIKVNFRTNIFFRLYLRFQIKYLPL